jgi:hypothetical protein
MTTRDDDPVHPNYDGIRFQATTDRTGVIAVPISAQTMPPVSFMPVVDAMKVTGELAELIAFVRKIDEASYLADFLSDVFADLTEAVEACAP